MSSSQASWCLIESDPGVFTELIRDIGVKDVQVEELYSLDDESLEALKPVYGLIFLFKWEKESNPDGPIVEAPNVFFANQVIPNACATQAILSVLMNRPEIDLGAEIAEFKEFTKEFPPEMKGLAIGNSDKIKDVHNSFARPETFLIDDKKLKGKEEDAFHFIAYVPFQGRLYELDGLQQGPIDLGECNDETWLALARPAIEKRIQKYSAEEIRFNLMAVIKDRMKLLQEQIAELQKKKEDGMDVDGSHIDAQIEELRMQMINEDYKMSSYQRENAWRKHNFIPFMINVLRVLAEKNELMPLVEKAKAKNSAKPAAKS